MSTPRDLSQLTPGQLVAEACHGDTVSEMRAAKEEIESRLRRLSDLEQENARLRQELADWAPELDEGEIDATAGFNAAEFDALNAEEG